MSSLNRVAESLGLDNMDGFQIHGEDGPVSVDNNGVEEELFDDPPAERSVELDADGEEIDRARLLAMFIDLGDRLSKGKKIIDEATTKRNASLTAYLEAKNQNLPYQNRNELWQTYGGTNGWKNRVNLLWDHWKKIRAEQAAMAEKYSWLWPLYFKARDEDLLLTFQPTDPVEVDEQIQLNTDQNDVADELGDAHVAEMAEYDRDVKVDWSYQDRVMKVREWLKTQNQVVSVPEQGELF